MAIYQLREEIQRLILEETLYLRHYIGKVIDNKDDLGKGRVFVAVAELGFDSAEQAIPCWPRGMNSMSVPKVGDSVEIYFMNADPSRGVYIGLANEIDGVVPESFSGDPDDHVLFEAPKTKADNLTYNKSKELVIFEGSDFAVKFNELETGFNQLRSDHNSFLTHVHTGVLVGFALSGIPTPPAVPSTADISNSKVDKVKL